jgi:hypothetical protein
MFLLHSEHPRIWERLPSPLLYHSVNIHGVWTHTEVKQYTTNGLEEDEFWVEGEKVVAEKAPGCRGCIGCKDT